MELYNTNNGDAAKIKILRNGNRISTYSEAIDIANSLDLDDGRIALVRYGESWEKAKTLIVSGTPVKGKNSIIEGGSASSVGSDDGQSINIDEILERIKTEGFITNIEKVDNEVDTYRLVDGNDDSDKTFKLNFTSGSDLTMLKAVGGMAAGTTIEQLKGMTLSQIIEGILFETVYPTIVDPSVTLSITNFNNNTVYKVGAAAPSESALNVVSKRGTATVGSKEDPYAGIAGTPSYTCKINTAAASSTLPSTFTEPGTYEYAANVVFAKGSNILDSKNQKAEKNDKGIAFTNPYESSTVKGTYTLYASYPYYTNGIFDTKLQNQKDFEDSADAEGALTSGTTAMDLVKWSTDTFYVKFASEAASSDGARITFEIPEGKTLASAQIYTKISGWQDFTMTPSGSVTHNGIYNVYKCTNSTLQGATKLKFTVN